ncbi:T9SS type A sorting domain-containing protein, partial [candidate division WOR-3 bacterium]|nr:T9SS type A sorting domain-containing protein [candidate division WOR-3 bacterium]
VWCYAGTDASIYGARVTQAGLVLDPAGINISTAYSYQGWPSVAFDGTNYFVVWEDRRNGWSNSDIYGARVNQAGAVLDPNGIAISVASGRQHNPTVAFDATNYLVVWDDSRDSLNGYDVYGTRVDQAGVVIDPTGIAISTVADNQRYPAVTFDGEHYLVVWQDSRYDYADIYGTRVSQAGIVLEPVGIAISTASDRQQYPMVAFGDTGFLVVWEDRRNGFLDPDIYSTRLSQEGVVLDSVGIVISTIANRQMCPSVAFDGTNFLLAWLDYHYESSNADIYAARVNSSGVVLDSATIAVVVGSNNQFPSVAFDGANYLIVWRRNTTIFGRRVSQTGEILGQPFVISNAAYGRQSPSASFDGTNYLVVWKDERNSNYPDIVSDIYGARVSPLGTVLDPTGIAISTAPSDQKYPSLAFDGTNYLVVWQDRRNSFYDDIYGTRVSQAGRILDTAGIAISTASFYQYSPAIAFDGCNFLTVWSDYRSSLNSPDIYGARVSPSGNVLDPAGLAISTAAEQQISPAIAFNGSNCLVVWSDNRVLSSYDLCAARVDSAGSVIDEFIVSSQTGDQHSPAIASGLGNQLLITYSGFADSVYHKPTNVTRIWGKLFPFTEIEEDVELNDRVPVSDLQVYPNPVNKECNIRYILSQESSVSISMFDVTGKFVKEIKNETQNVGVYNKKFDITNLSQGVYFIRFTTGDHSETKKVIFIR